MKVTIVSPKVKEINNSHRKENHLYKSYLVISPELKEVITLRLYFPNQVCYACLWVRAGEYRSASGSAGGGGYHKQSAATGEAIDKAGYMLSESINGRGDQAIELALLAIAEAEGFEGCKIFTAHG